MEMTIIIMGGVFIYTSLIVLAYLVMEYACFLRDIPIRLENGLPSKYSLFQYLAVRDTDHRGKLVDYHRERQHMGEEIFFCIIGCTVILIWYGVEIGINRLVNAAKEFKYEVEV